MTDAMASSLSDYRDLLDYALSKPWLPHDPDPAWGTPWLGRSTDAEIAFRAARLDLQALLELRAARGA